MRRVDLLAATFPELTIIAAHPGWPWVEEMTAVALHKGNVYWELSGWAPKHFPASLKTDIRGRLQDKIMFGSDYPSLPLDRLLREWDVVATIVSLVVSNPFVTGEVVVIDGGYSSTT
jgi:uncharacterized protein